MSAASRLRRRGRA